MAGEERLLRFENALSSLSELAGQQDARIAGLAQSIEILVQLARSADERMNQQLAWINQLGAAQANADTRIAALADAQIRTEEALARLAEAQAHTDQRLDALIDIVRDGRNGTST